MSHRPAALGSLPCCASTAAAADCCRRPEPAGGWLACAASHAPRGWPAGLLADVQLYAGAGAGRCAARRRRGRGRSARPADSRGGRVDRLLLHHQHRRRAAARGAARGHQALLRHRRGGADRGLRRGHLPARVCRERPRPAAGDPSRSQGELRYGRGSAALPPRCR